MMRVLNTAISYSLPPEGRVGRSFSFGSGGGVRKRSTISTPPVRFADTLPIKGRDGVLIAGIKQFSGVCAQTAE